MENKRIKGRDPKIAAPARHGIEKLAVLVLGGKQQLVREGSEILVNHLDLKEGKSAKAPAVILEPAPGQGSVTYKVLGQEKGPKILVMKYKAKSRYRRKRGYRSQLSRIVVEKIEV
ncbi:MAG: bL21 family ribosomal protein [Patescibacteria group bacterium]